MNIGNNPKNMKYPLSRCNCPLVFLIRMFLYYNTYVVSAGIYLREVQVVIRCQIEL